MKKTIIAILVVLLLAVELQTVGIPMVRSLRTGEKYTVMYRFDIFKLPIGYQNGRVIVYEWACIADRLRTMGDTAVSESERCSWTGSKTLNSYSVSSEEALEIAKRTFRELGPSTSIECLVLGTSYEAPFVTYSADRKFITGCPGGPGTNEDPPAIPAIKIDRRDGSVLVESIDGVFRSL